MSSLLPLGDAHADQTNRLRRHHAAEAAQGALTVLRAHCLPANLDTDQVHGPELDHERRMYAAMAGEHRLSYVGKGDSVIGRCSCEMWCEFGRSHLGSKRAAIKREHERHAANCQRATTAWA